MVENEQRFTKPPYPGKDQPFSGAFRAVVEVILLAAVTFVPTVGLASVVSPRAGPAAQPESANAPLAAGSGAALVIAAVQLLLMVLIMTRGGRDYGLRLAVRDLYQAPVVAVGALLLLFAAAVALQQLPSAVVERLTSGYRWGLQSWQLLPLATMFVLLASYREELFFRAFLLTRLREQGVPAWLTVAASSLLFAAGHLYQGLFAAVVALLLGAYLGIWFIARPALHRLALGHSLFNVAVLTVTLFPAVRFATFGE